ncbi:unnamed protein product, partial [Adineta ricciae]
VWAPNGMFVIPYDRMGDTGFSHHMMITKRSSIGVVNKVLAFFSEILWNNLGSSRSFHPKDVDVEPKINPSHEEIRVLLLHEFRLGHEATEAANNICSTLSQSVVSIRTAQRWFNHFKNGDLELDDVPRSSRPIELDMDLLKQLIEEDPRLTLRCLAEQLECFHTTVEKNLNELSKAWKNGRVDTCMDLITFHRNYQWLAKLITGNEKWVLYVNYTRGRQRLSTGQTGVATPKTDPHPKKLMLNV